MNPMRGVLMILSGPSGVGKDTVIEAWRAIDPTVHRVVAYATRDPRPGEVNGYDYHFISRDAFLAKAVKGDFLEYKEVHGNFYATPLTDMEQMLAEGKVAILKIDVQGALEAMKLRPDAVSVFLLPPSEQELERRLRGRGTEDEEKLQIRLANALGELALATHYQHQVRNESVEEVVAELAEIVRKERGK